MKDVIKGFYRKRITQIYCDKCAGYQKKSIKTLVCCDCGNEFTVDSRNMKKVRCDNCQKIHRKEWDRKRKSNKKN